MQLFPISIIIPVALCTVTASASPSVNFTGMNGSNQATVTFTLTTESTLQVTLSNTSLNAATSTFDVLTGFFFANPTAVTAQSVAVAPGSSIVNCAVCPAGVSDISGQWRWAPGVAGMIGPEAVNVFASTSFGFLDRTIGATPLTATSSANNVDFGLVSNTSSFGQSLLTGSPLVTQTVVITLQTSTGFSLDNVGLVGFLWGSTFGTFGGDFEELKKKNTPEPGTFGLLAAGCTGLLLAASRRPTLRP